VGDSSPSDSKSCSGRRRRTLRSRRTTWSTSSVGPRSEGRWTMGRHNRCGGRHRSYPLMAECKWPEAYNVIGNGRVALLTCDHATVVLHHTLDDAQTHLEFLNEFGCEAPHGGERCWRGHTLHLLPFSLAASVEAESIWEERVREA